MKDTTTANELIKISATKSEKLKTFENDKA